MDNINDDQSTNVSPIALAAALTGILALVFSIVYLFLRSPSTQKTSENEEKSEEKTENSQKKSTSRNKPTGSKFVKSENKNKFSHPWLCTSLKAHSASVTALDFSHHDKYLASVSDDETVLLWPTKQFNEKDQRHTRVNIEYGQASRVAFSPDEKAFLVNVLKENIIRVYKFERRADGLPTNVKTALEFPKRNESEIISIGIACTGKFIMSAEVENKIVISDIKGEILGRVDTHQGYLNYAAVSPCGRFFGCCGFTSDVRFFEVYFDKTNGSFKEIRKAFELKGHGAQVLCFSLNKDSTRAATISKDKTWKLWNTDVDFLHKQDPKCFFTGSLPKMIEQTGLIVLSPDALSAVISIDQQLFFYNLASEEKKLEETIENPHSEPIRALKMDSVGRYVATAGDRQIRIFHNLAGLKASVDDLSEKLTAAKQLTLRERIQEQIEEANSKIQQILDSTA